LNKLRLQSYLFSICLGLLVSSFARASEAIPLAINLAEDGKVQQHTNRSILLYVSAPHCVFCKKLEKEVLFPLIRSGEYQDKIILRKIDWTSSTPIKNFSGNSMIPKAFLKDYNIQITPTLLFLDANGNQIIERLLGYRGGEFFWYYFDVAIEKANKRLAKRIIAK
jgi:thioredoxin-related protein